jgi:hypothetical protein
MATAKAPSLDDALRHFDRVQANLARAESLWTQIEAALPTGYDFSGSDPSGFDYRQKCRGFHELIQAGLPPIDGFKVTSRPLEVDELSQRRFDADEIGEPEAHISIYQDQTAPRRELEEYRYRLARERRKLVRRRIEELIVLVDGLLNKLDREFGTTETVVSVKGHDWTSLTSAVDELDRLVGSVPRPKAWAELRRHLHFGDTSDLENIRERDWPECKASLAELAYEETEALPVPLDDLAALVAAKPSGPVSTALNWSAIKPEGFERVVFELISNVAGYVNPQWLMDTNAPDRGRDLAVERVRMDPLTGQQNERILIQCKRVKKSISDNDVSDTLTKITHWEPPKIDVLIFATTGRFSADAVKFVERHNNERKGPRIEMWPESHLERLLAERPHIAAAFGLR